MKHTPKFGVQKICVRQSAKLPIKPKRFVFVSFIFFFRNVISVSVMCVCVCLSYVIQSHLRSNVIIIIACAWTTVYSSGHFMAINIIVNFICVTAWTGLSSQNRYLLNDVRPANWSISVYNCNSHYSRTVMYELC